MTSIPALLPHAIFGLRTEMENNVYYVTDDEILYPAAAVIILHKYVEKKQRYIKLFGKSVKMTGMAISPNRKKCAIIENIENPRVIIYDLDSLKRIRTLTLPAGAPGKKIESIDFSFDEVMLMVLTGEPDWTMYAYNWERGKVETSTKATYLNNPRPVAKVLCSPADATNVILYGSGIFRMMIMQETVWKQYGFQKADTLDISSCAYLGGDRILIGTYDGLIVLIEIGELKFIYDATTVTQINPRAEKNDEDAIGVGSAMLLPKVQEQDAQRDKGVRALISFSRGFAYSCGPGLVHFFEKMSAHQYVKRNVYKIEEPDYKEIPKEEVSVIRHLDINLSETYLLATTSKSHIYHVKLWGPAYDIAGEILFQTLETFHTGPVKSLAVSKWKSIFITCGAIDRTVRVWNYEQEEMEMVKQYQEDVHSICLHPTGLFAAIGFSDKLRVLAVMIDDLQIIREFPIRDCYLSAFSCGGQTIAAVSKFIIHLYHTVSFQNLPNLRGHCNKITALVWSEDDKKMVSCGMEGAVYEWDMTTGKRIGEIMTKGISHNSCCLTADGSVIYAVGSDGCIREICNSNILRVMNLNNGSLTTIVMAKSEQSLFVGSNTGVIMSIKMPLMEPVEYTIYHYHKSPVSCLRLSVDDQTLISSSDGGQVGIWKVTSADGRTAPDREYVYFNEILISQNDLEEKLGTIRDLNRRMDELEMEHAYQMRHLDANFNEVMKEIHSTYSLAVEELKGNLKSIEANHNTELNNISSDINVIKERHEIARLELEAKFNAKLIVEYDKYLTLGKAKDEMITEYKVKLAELEESKRTTIEELTRVNESQLFNFNKMLEESLAEIEKEINDHDEITRQIEDDNDREIETLRKKYEDQLRSEKESNIRLRGEAGVMKKKFLSAQKDISTVHMEIIFIESEQDKFKAMIRKLEKDIIELKKEMSERDVTVQEKEKKIYDLKRKDQELERCKYVLNYKIKELKNQIEPRDKEIREMKEQISGMELELENFLKINSTLDTNLTFLRDKLSEIYKSVIAFKVKYRNVLKVLRGIKLDICNATGCIQEYNVLQSEVKKLYNKYITDEEFIKARKGEEDCHAEFSRQMEYLEYVISGLKKQVEKDTEEHFGENMQFMETNWGIMDEIYKMRKEIKVAKRKVQDLEALLCFRSSKLYSPRKAIQMVQQALRSPGKIKFEEEEKMEEAKVKTCLVKEEAERLQEFYTEMQYQYDRK